MSDQIKNERMQRINQMLLEMAGGNFFYRLERSGENDNIEALVVILNMLAEEIQESFLHQGYVNSKGTTKPIVQMFFMLNANGIIQMINQKTCTILSTLYNDIIEKPFDSFLTKASKTKWKNTWKALQQKDFCDTSLELTFKAKGQLLVPNSCYITTFKGIGKAKLYNFLPKDEKAKIPELSLIDSQISTIAKDYYADANFCRNTDGTINLWNVYNLFTGANKGSYIDSFLSRNVNAFSFSKGLAETINGGNSYEWFLN